MGKPLDIADLPGPDDVVRLMILGGWRVAIERAQQIVSGGEHTLKYALGRHPDSLPMLWQEDTAAIGSPPWQEHGLKLTYKNDKVIFAYA